MKRVLTAVLVVIAFFVGTLVGLYYNDYTYGRPQLAVDGEPFGGGVEIPEESTAIDRDSFLEVPRQDLSL